MKEYFIKKIKVHGPLSVAEYMSESMLAPKIGYYDSKISIGKKGDFITGPEISQMFGELIGIFFIECWEINKSPSPIQFVDLGGGNGTMMKDSLRTIKNIKPNFYNKLNPIFVEQSSILIKNQKLTVPNSNFINEVDQIPSGNLFIIANEFFDCLPIHQFIRNKGRWYERLVGLDDQNHLIFTCSLKPTIYEKVLPKNYNDGEIYELSNTIIQTIHSLSKLINNLGGILLIIDYAYSKKERFGTLQAVKNHQYVDPLNNPGNSDISCKVNFDLLSSISKEVGLKVYGPITQKLFFERLGINIRCQQLILKNPKKEKHINTDKHRLISEDEMGNIFNVIAITSKNYIVPKIFQDMT